MPHYKVEPSAYGIPLLHATKYQSAEICGVLLGKADGNDTWRITKAVPLLHHWTAMTPMLEVALKQVAIHAASLDVEIIGFYQANEHNNDTTLHENAIKVADTIRKNSVHAVIFVVNNENCASLVTDKSNDKDLFLVHTYEDSHWKLSTKSLVLTDDNTLANVRGKLSVAAYRNLIDFDDHLEDVSLDWLGANKF